MTENEHKPCATPWWVWCVMVGLALIEPLSHGWILLAPPAGHVPTGLHTVDTYAYRSAMAHYHDDYYSPYATVDSSVGDRDPSLYALPHHRMYGWLGLLTQDLPLNPFIVLGMTHGLGLLFMLLMAWGLLRVSVPKLAATAFSLFALGGGAGGILYVLCWFTGLTDHADFADSFQHFFLYELCEGARYQPYLLTARLYYTVAMGLGFAALRIQFSLLRQASTGRALMLLVVYGLCAFSNFRVGPMFWAVGIMHLLVFPALSMGQRIKFCSLITVGTGLGAVLALRMLRLNPELTESAFRILSGQLWLFPLLSALGLVCLLLPLGLVQGMGHNPRWARALAMGAVGYLLLYGLGYVGYVAYYGNWWLGGETAAAIAVSDWAFLGIVPGLWLGWRRGDGRGEMGSAGWYVLWGLAFLCGSLTAMGQGWFLQFMPQRFVVILGLPFAVVGAMGLQQVGRTWPRVAQGLHGGIIFCGVLSILVTWMGTYGPLGHDGLQGSYTWTRQAYMTEQDGQLFQGIEGEVVLAPSTGTPLFGDVAVLRGHKTVYGNGTLDYSRNIMPEIRKTVHEFFTQGTPEATRRALVDRYGVTVVFCPDTAAVNPEVMKEFKTLPWLQVQDSAGQGVVFRVQP